MIKSTKVSATNVSVPRKVHTVLLQALPIGGGVTGLSKCNYYDLERGGGGEHQQLQTSLLILVM